MSVRVEVKGLYEAVLLIERVSRIARIHWPNRVLDNLARHAEQKMKELVPKKTGRLRRSIRVESLPDARRIIADTPYARIVNDGARPHYIYQRNRRALAFFKEKYPEKVTVYSINNFSKEICAGPHIKRTSELGRFEIIKEESLGSGMRRIRAVLIPPSKQ